MHLDLAANVEKIEFSLLENNFGEIMGFKFFSKVEAKAEMTSFFRKLMQSLTDETFWMELTSNRSIRVYQKGNSKNAIWFPIKNEDDFSQINKLWFSEIIDLTPKLISREGCFGVQVSPVIRRKPR